LKLITRQRAATAVIILSALVAACAAQKPISSELLPARKALGDKHYQQAEDLFAAYLKTHPGNIDAEEGIGDAKLGLHDYEAAELQYRAVVAAQPEFWIAHKNLVIVEAALGRWEEFDRERAVLRGARQRGAPGISTRESDVIDAFDVHGEHWIVREYYEPVAARSLATTSNTSAPMAASASTSHLNQQTQPALHLSPTPTFSSASIRAPSPSSRTSP